MRPRPEQWIVNGNPNHLQTACEASLKRLKLEQLDSLGNHLFPF